MAIETHDQPDGSVYANPAQGSRIELKKKGDYETLKEEAESDYKQGEPIEGADGWLVRSWTLRRLPGGIGELTVEGVYDDGSTYNADDNPVPKPFKTVWSLKTVRNDVPAMAYCGESPGANPQRVYVEKWLAEKDPEVAKKGNFIDTDGTEFDMENDAPATLALIKKMQKGIEAVMRFYPVVTRRKYYRTAPRDVLENLGFIDAPPSPDGTDQHPGALGSKMNLYQWLKCQDDCDPQSDGDWIRTESWMGILKGDGENGQSPWDPDLYGENRWSMPAKPLEKGGGK